MDELTTIETLSPSVSSSPSTSSQDTVSFERKNKDPNINISSPLPVKRGLAEQKVIRTPNGMLNLDDDREHRAPTIKPVVTTQQNSTFVMVDTPTININNNNNNSNDIIANALMAKSKVKQYQCALCPNDPPYAGASGLWYHMKRHHGAKTRPYNKRKEDEIKAQKKLKKQKKERKMSSALKRGKNIGVKRPRGRPSMEIYGNKGTPPRHPKVKGKKKPKPIIMGKNGKPLSKYMMKKRERMMEKEKAKKKISQLVNNWLQRHDISAEESNAEEEEEEEEEEESSKEEESSEEEDSDSDSSEEEEEDDDDDSSEESGSSSDEDSSDDDDDDEEEDEEEEEEEEEKPTISRNNEMMKLVKRSNSKSSSKKKFLNNRTMDNDPFLLLAEVAECVSPRMYKRQKRKGNFTTVQIKQIKVDAFPTSPTNRR